MNVEELVQQAKSLKKSSKPAVPYKKKPRKPHPSKGKLRKSYTGSQRLRAPKASRQNPPTFMAPKTSIRRWKDQEKFLLKQPFRKLRNTTYFLQDKNDVKFTVVYPLQQERLKNEIIDKRGTGEPVSPERIGNRMFQICVDEMPSGFDPTNKNQFNKRWVSDYMSRKGLSVCQATNKKKQSVFEKLHKIHGFHWYVYPIWNGFCSITTYNGRGYDFRIIRILRRRGI